jgi:aspartate ammonia-lyase
MERDFIGTVSLEDDIYYGISSLRAKENFQINNQTTHKDIIHELINIKKQAVIVNHSLGYISEEKKDVIVEACNLLLDGKHADMFIVPKHQGGAGTSTNMNVNEVISNVALKEWNKCLGEYHLIHPINDINKHQSTNDVYPTAVKIAVIKKVRDCAEQYATIQKVCQEKETEFDSILKLGRTQMMDAVPMRVGQMFSAYAEVFSRDRWRIYKAEERLRTINIGGTAIGTGLNAPLKYMFLMTDKLRESTGIGLARAENLVDNTQNTDAFLEVSGLLKTAAASLVKIANDLRLLGSGPHGGFGEVELPQRQVGSSIMPGKVNPVILEMVIMNSHKVISNDILVSSLVSSGSLELNPFIPMIAETLIESLELLSKTVSIFTNKCLKDIKINKGKCMENVLSSYSLITPLIHVLGYDRATEIVSFCQTTNQNLQDVLLKENQFSKEELKELLDPFNITKPGIIEVVK